MAKTPFERFFTALSPENQRMVKSFSVSDRKVRVRSIGALLPEQFFFIEDVALMEQVSSTLLLKDEEYPTAEQVLRATRCFSPDSVFVGELTENPERIRDFLASIEAQSTDGELS